MREYAFYTKIQSNNFGKPFGQMYVNEFFKQFFLVADFFNFLSFFFRKLFFVVLCSQEMRSLGDVSNGSGLRDLDFLKAHGRPLSYSDIKRILGSATFCEVQDSLGTIRQSGSPQFSNRKFRHEKWFRRENNTETQFKHVVTKILLCSNKFWNFWNSSSPYQLQSQIRVSLYFHKKGNSKKRFSSSTFLENLRGNKRIMFDAQSKR